eukprot:TRINITY_DN75996_c0_g1_i1.p1 TRINITY_DN75996_c0_g1~~TRINITY_DN75996_c0_g1_i1.p1  ORF type:complete len:303 (-),score=34.92 TRINITY_DN75996_c0_g1_i1:197-1105(-)
MCALAAWDPWPWLLPVDGAGPAPVGSSFLDLHMHTAAVQSASATETSVGPLGLSCGGVYTGWVDPFGVAPAAFGISAIDGVDKKGVREKVKGEGRQEVEEVQTTPVTRTSTEMPTMQQRSTFSDKIIADAVDGMSGELTQAVSCAAGAPAVGVSTGGSAPSAGATRRRAPVLLILRGLPFMATEADVASFVEKAGVSRSLAKNQPISLLDDAIGRPSGFCVLQLAVASELQEVQRKLHMQRLGSRYIEALLPGRHEKWVASAVAKWKGLSGLPASRPSQRRTGDRRGGRGVGVAASQARQQA